LARDLRLQLLAVKLLSKAPTAGSKATRASKRALRVERDLRRRRCAAPPDVRECKAEEQRSWPAELILTHVAALTKPQSALRRHGTRDVY
jgi:hypothetical protein